jgi:hypothetical protein
MERVGAILHQFVQHRSIGRSNADGPETIAADDNDMVRSNRWKRSRYQEATCNQDEAARSGTYVMWQPTFNGTHQGLNIL